MNEHRLRTFRAALSSLVESLEATVRIARWTDAEPVPTPIEDSAARLLDHFGAANRFVADKFTGPRSVVECMTAMSTATRLLDAAYAEYQRGVGQNGEGRDEAAIALDHELERVKAESHLWG